MQGKLARLVARIGPVPQPGQLLCLAVQAPEQLATLGRSVGPSGRQQDPPRGSSSRGNPDASWWSIPRRTCRWSVDRFFSRADPVRMDLDAGAVQRHRRRLEPPELFLLEGFEHPVKDSVLRPAIHPGGEGMPPPEPRRESATCPLLGDRQEGIESGQIRDLHIPPLPRPRRRNAFGLSFGQFHLRMIPLSNPFV